MTSRACPVCGSEAASVFAEQRIDAAALDGFAFASRKQPEYMHYRLVSCPVCDLVYASPAPGPETLAGAYVTAAYDSSEEARWAARTYRRLLQPVLASLGASSAGLGSALDIGAGDGAFLEELLAARFRHVEGVEPSDAPRRSAKPHIRPLIHEGLFSPEVFDGRRFDLITCLQTIEHVHDPLALCREAWSLLEDGGALFIVCHNRRAASAKLLGRHSPIFDVEHLQLFSPRSLRRLLGESGFTDVSVRPVLNSYPIRYWARLAPIPARPKARVQEVLAGRLGSLPLMLPAGNVAAWGYRRPSSSPS
ncbi:MAG TPA: class I SAM-dependent methyltransferase [Actinomycetota bacterium]